MKTVRKLLAILLALTLSLAVFPVLAEEGTASITVTFDLNTTPDLTDDETYVYTTTGYDANWQPVTEEKPAVFPAEDGVLSVDLPVPAREGWYFAGWQTKADVTEADLINGVSPFLWLPGHKASPFGQAMQAPDEVMDLTPYADENGQVRLYARWVQPKAIDSPEALQAMANDLYGAYKLTADIDMSGFAFIPVGCYFKNYELFETAWWTYAFRGTLLGSGHTISGLTLNSAARDIAGYQDTPVWHDDGVTCDGTVGLFGAIAGASISDLILQDAVIDLAGEHAYDGGFCYVGTIAAFDMASTLRNIQVINVTIRVETTEATAEHRDSAYVSVAGLEGGGWNSTVGSCAVSGQIDLTVTTAKSHGGSVYLGGMIAENYANITGCRVEGMKLALNHQDISEKAEDEMLTVNVGGLGGSNTSSTGCTVDAEISVNVAKPVGQASVAVGGFTGSQYYMTATENKVNAAISMANALDPEQGSESVGSVAGRFDAFWALQILQYTPIAACGTSGNTTAVTLNGETVEKVIGTVPELDGQPLGWINNGEYQIAEGYVAPSNVEAVIEKYGSPVPQEALMQGIIWIQAD
ncbi:MAG: hypothetical protein IKH18_07210 [Clostridia bacterium]|nr:hypothetical protein [Clostridia bacterium]